MNLGWCTTIYWFRLLEHSNEVVVICLKRIYLLIEATGDIIRMAEDSMEMEERLNAPSQYAYCGSIWYNRQNLSFS